MPADALALIEDAAHESLFLSADWFALAPLALPDGVTPLFVRFDFGAGAVLLPLARAGRRLSGLASPYTCLYRPLVSPRLPLAALGAVGGWLARRAWRAGPIRLDALDAAWPGLPPLLRGAFPFGFARAFDHFGGWTEDVAGLDWPAYLASRPGALRETIRRKSRRAALALRLSRDPADFAAYDAVARRSWKQAEPHPAFLPAFAAAMAAAGALRIGIAEAEDGAPVAAQLWTVEGGRATVHKLAHDEARAATSPGTVLTAFCVESILAEGGIHALDFGRGDDAYKRLWTTRRARRVGVLVTPAFAVTEGARLALGRARALARGRGLWE